MILIENVKKGAKPIFAKALLSAVLKQWVPLNTYISIMISMSFIAPDNIQIKVMYMFYFSYRLPRELIRKD